MDIISLLMEYGPPVVSGLFAAVAVSQNQSAKKTVNQIAPTVGTVMNALPQIIADVQKSNSPMDKIGTAVTEVAQVLAPVLPQAQHVIKLIDALEGLAQSLKEHTETMKQQQGPTP